MFIVAAGMTTCIGNDRAGSSAALRCRLAGFNEIPYTDIRNVPIVGAPIGHIRSLRKGRARLVDLAVPALEECLKGLGDVDIRRVPLLLATPTTDDMPSWVATQDDALLSELTDSLCIQLSTYSAVLRGGASAAVVALSRARKLIAQGLVPSCIVGGVDTLIDQDRLRSLEIQRRLKIDSDQDGLIPGEAACMVLCKPTRSTDHLSILVGGLAVADSAGVPRGRVLSNVLRGALAEAGRRSSDISVLITDLTGERDLSMEYTLALTRTFSEPQDWLHTWHLAMSVGTVGAAALPVSLGWLLSAGHLGYAPGSHAICTAISDPGHRAVGVFSLVG